MKKIAAIILTLGVLTSACNKMLDEEVVSKVTDDFYNTKAGFQTAVNGGYAGFRAFYSTERGMNLTIFGTDTYTNGSDGDFKFANQYTPTLNPQYAHIRELWNAFYQALNTCNVAIDRAPIVSDIDDAARKVGIGEARFCRAQYHFILMQLFGPVPLKLKENKEASAVANRDPIDAIYKAIIEDLEFATQYLPLTQSEWGRATKPAAEHLLARVYLTRASSTAKQGTDYANAAKYATSVISNYGFQLLTDVGQVFAQGKENNPETVWAVQYTTDALYNSGDNNANRFFLMQYDILPGMKRDLPNGTPWKRYKPTDFLIDTLYKDRVNDTRYEKFFTSVWYANVATANLKIGDTAIWLPGYDVSDAFIASKKYLVVPPRKYTLVLYPSLNKHNDALRPDNQASGVRPFIAFRLAEDYLIAGEAYMMTGETDKAVQYINTLRMRSARVTADPTQTAAYREAMKIGAAQLNIDFILDERERELVGEQLRWFDLVRTNKLLERVRKHNYPVANLNIAPKHMLRPIPQDQIDRTSNPFPQNEGY